MPGQSRLLPRSNLRSWQARRLVMGESIRPPADSVNRNLSKLTLPRQTPAIYQMASLPLAEFVAVMLFAAGIVAFTLPFQV